MFWLAIKLISFTLETILFKAQLLASCCGHKWPNHASKHLCFMLLYLCASVANSLLSQELKLFFSDTKFTKASHTKKILDFFLDATWDTEQYQILSQIPKYFANTKCSIWDTKMATLLLHNLTISIRFRRRWSQLETFQRRLVSFSSFFVQKFGQISFISILCFTNSKDKW